MTVRVNTGALAWWDDDWRALDWVECMQPLSKAGAVGSEQASARVGRTGGTVRGRLCPLGETKQAFHAQRDTRKGAVKKGREPL